jgi:hypothetical protein
MPLELKEAMDATELDISGSGKVKALVAPSAMTRGIFTAGMIACWRFMLVAGASVWPPPPPSGMKSTYFSFSGGMMRITQNTPITRSRTWKMIEKESEPAPIFRQIDNFPGAGGEGESGE